MTPEGFWNRSDSLCQAPPPKSGRRPIIPQFCQTQTTIVDWQLRDAQGGSASEKRVAMATQTNTLDRAADAAPGARILQNYAGGRWVAAKASGLLDVTNPASGEVLARVPLSGRADVETAVAAASAALPDWRARAVGERTQFIY